MTHHEAAIQPTNKSKIAKYCSFAVKNGKVKLKCHKLDFQGRYRVDIRSAAGEVMAGSSLCVPHISLHCIVVWSGECFSVAYVHWHWIGFTAAFNDNVILFSIFDRRVACMGPIYSAFCFNVIVVEIKSRLIDITSL